MPIDPASLSSLFGRSANTEPPRYLGTRYDQTGRFLADPGNTVVCHLEPGSATQAALEAVRDIYLDMDAAGDLAFTAPDSLHMTLFQGILDRRRAMPYWPGDVAPDWSVDAMTDHFLQRLQTFEPGPEFRVQVVQAMPTGLLVEGVSDADRRAMADWRNRLADCLGYRHPDHDEYVFHITYAYPIRWIADDRLGHWQTLLDGITSDLRRQVPVLELRPPAFCSFMDMNWFEELLVLDHSGVASPQPA